jgi:uncharacterized protein YndB with AHSA1/START domain
LPLLGVEAQYRGPRLVDADDNPVTWTAPAPVIAERARGKERAMGQDWIEREIIIDASPDRVWAVLTEAEPMASWFGDSAAADLRHGGKAIFGRTGDGDFWTVVEHVARPTVLSYRWAREAGTELGEGASTLVEFTLTETPVGTLLRVVESGFDSLHVSPDALVKAAAEGSQGWIDGLAQLKDFAERSLT